MNYPPKPIFLRVSFVDFWIDHCSTAGDYVRSQICLLAKLRPWDLPSPMVSGEGYEVTRILNFVVYQVFFFCYRAHVFHSWSLDWSSLCFWEFIAPNHTPRQRKRRRLNRNYTDSLPGAKIRLQWFTEKWFCYLNCTWYV